MVSKVNMTTNGIQLIKKVKRKDSNSISENPDIQTRIAKDDYKTTSSSVYRAQNEVLGDQSTKTINKEVMDIQSTALNIEPEVNNGNGGIWPGNSTISMNKSSSNNCKRNDFKMCVWACCLVYIVSGFVLFAIFKIFKYCCKKQE